MKPETNPTITRTPIVEPSASGVSDLLTKREVASRLRRTPRCIELWMRKRYLPYIKIGRSVYFRWSDVSSQLDKFRVN